MSNRQLKKRFKEGIRTKNKRVYAKFKEVPLIIRTKKKENGYNESYITSSFSLTHDYYTKFCLTQRVLRTNPSYWTFPVSSPPSGSDFRRTQEMVNTSESAHCFRETWIEKSIFHFYYGGFDQYGQCTLIRSSLVSSMSYF